MAHATLESSTVIRRVQPVITAIPIAETALPRARDGVMCMFV